MAFGSSAGALASLTYLWDFGDGSTSTEAAPSHRFAAGGDYEVVLKVTDRTGNSGETRKTVSINNLTAMRGLECSGPGNTGWCWQLARPTGNPVNDVSFLNATTGWIAGDAGEIFKTTDAGASWVRQKSGTRAPIRVIRMLDARIGWAITEDGAALRTMDGGDNWVTVKPASGNPDRREGLVVKVLSGTTAYVGKRMSADPSAAIELYSTGDGGQTWQRVVTPPFSEFRIMSFFSIWGVRGSSILHSGTAGQSWDEVLVVPQLQGLTASEVRTENVPLLFEDRPSFVRDDLRASVTFTAYRLNPSPADKPISNVYTTLDGGKTWRGGPSSTYVAQLTSVSADGRKLTASSYSGVNGFSAVRSTDGGASWATQYPLPAWADVVPYPWASFTYAATAWGALVASGPLGSVISEDDGESWLPYAPASTYKAGSPIDVRQYQGRVLTPVVARRPIYAAAFADASKGFVSSTSGGDLLTQDGGRTWQPWAHDFGGLASLQFVSKSTGWLVDGKGGLRRSSDGGQTWAAVAEAIGLRSAYFENDTLGWSELSTGKYASTRDGGKTWRAFALPQDASVKALRMGAKTWMALGFGNLYTSADEGASWRLAYRKSATGAEFRALSFSDENTVWAVGEAGGLVKSSDGGATWAAVELPTDYQRFNFNDIRFANAQVGWIVGERGAGSSGGLILATRDGGKTWQLQVSGTDRGLIKIAAVDTKTAWVVVGGDPGLGRGVGDALLATGSGGN